MNKIDPCWFGKRQIVYVTVTLPSHLGRDSIRNFVVYGHSITRVSDEIFRSLSKIFGWHGGGHVRKGRKPKKNPRRKVPMAQKR